MSDKYLQEAFVLITKLSAAERSLLVSRLQLLGIKSNLQTTDHASLVYNKLASLIGHGFPPLVQARKSKCWKQFVMGADSIFAFIDEVFADQNHNAKKQALITILTCVLDELHAEGSNKLWEIAYKLNHIREVLDNAFPGYLSSGLLVAALLKDKKDGRLQT
jgi:hypothetical protein